jgi:hypothetical protein
MARRSRDRASRLLHRISSALIFSMSLVAADASIARAQTVTHSENANPSIWKSAPHLQAASDLLARVPDPVDGEAAKRIADLRRHFTAMVALYRGEAPPSGTRPGTEEDGQPVDWKVRFSDVERDLTKILGGATPLGPATGIAVAPAAASGVLEVDPRGVPAPDAPAGPKPGVAAVPEPAPESPPAGAFPAADLFAIAAAKAGPIGFPELDLEVRRVLDLFRVELELFYTYANSGISSGKNRASS